jgi:hypothetical protein
LCCVENQSHTTTFPTRKIQTQAESPTHADMSRFKQMCIQLKNEPFATSGGGKKNDA